MKKCTVDDCEIKPHAQGMCNTHYARWRRTGAGKPERVYLPQGTSMEDRMKYHLPSREAGECWEWQGRLNLTGYGVVGKNKLAHRVAYELWNGELTEGLHVCHSCDNPKCCNPEHLFLGTQRDNIRDMVDKRRHRWGEDSYQCKLSDAEVAEIRRLARAGFTYTAIAEKFDTDRRYVGELVAFKKRKLPSRAYVRAA